jgi:hypothetical protein
MKLRFLSSAVAAVALMIASQACAEAPASAPSQSLLLSGSADIQGGWRHLKEDDDDVSDSHGTYGGSARLNVPFSTFFRSRITDMMSVQLDGQTEAYNESTGEGTPSSNTAYGAHLSIRDPQYWLLGIFASRNSPHPVQPTAKGHWVEGIEGQAYWNDFTLYGQYGHANIRSETYDAIEGFSAGWFWRGAARYFIQDNTMVQADLSWGRTSKYIDSDDDGRIWNWSLSGASHLPVNMPLYSTLEYRGGKYDSTTEGDIGRDHAFLAGLSFRFGANSLKENDRRGATLDLPMLPTRAASWAESLD